MTEVHLLGNEIWPSGTGGSSRKRSAPLSASRAPGAAGCARDVDRANAGVRHWAAHQNGVRHARQDQIGDELPLTRQ